MKKPTTLTMIEKEWNVIEANYPKITSLLSFSTIQELQTIAGDILNRIEQLYARTSNHLNLLLQLQHSDRTKLWADADRYTLAELERIKDYVITERQAIIS